MGKPETPSVPSVSGTSKKAVSAQVENLPAILKAQQDYGGQFTAADLDVLQKYAPQMQSIIKSMQEPSVAAGESMINKYLSQPDVLSDVEKQTATADLRAATSSRGLGESGMAAIEELRGLTTLRQQLKSQQLNIAMQMAGRGATGLQSVSALQGLMPGQLVQNVQPSQIFGLTQSNYQNQLAQSQNQGSAIGGALGGALGGAATGSAFGPWGMAIGAGVGGVSGYLSNS